MHFEVGFFFVSFFFVKGIVVFNHDKIIINFKKLVVNDLHTLARMGDTHAFWTAYTALLDCLSYPIAV